MADPLTRTRVHPHRRLPRAACFLLGLGGLVGCHDSPVDPLATITTVETVPSLALSSSLPDLAELAQRIPRNEVVVGAAAAWEASWDREDGEMLRTLARQELAPVIHDLLGNSAPRTAIASLDWLRETPDLPHRLPESLGVPIQEALELLDRAETRLQAGDGTGALMLALAASDRVRSVTPEAVARRLIARGQGLLESDGRDLGETQRARHLLSGAQRALEREDWSRAIQRAFYGYQVLQGPGALPVDSTSPGPRTAPGGPL